MIRRPAGSTAKERDPGEPRPIGRNSAQSPLTWGDYAEVRTSWICGRLRRICRKPREIPAGRRSATRRLLRQRGVIHGASRPGGRNSAKSPPTRGDRAGYRTVRICRRLRTISSRNLEKSRRVADPPPGRFYGEGEGFMGIPPDRREFSGITTYAVRLGGISHLMDLWPIV